MTSTANEAGKRLFCKCSASWKRKRHENFWRVVEPQLIENTFAFLGRLIHRAVAPARSEKGDEVT